MNKRNKRKHKIFYFYYVDIIIIFSVLLVLAIIASPSFFSVADNAKRAPSLHIIQEINWKQESYFLRNNTFARSLEQLNIRIPSGLNNYRYSIQLAEQSVFHYAISLQPDKMALRGGFLDRIFSPSPKQYAFPSYLGMLWTVPNPSTDPDEDETDLILHSVLCRSTYPHILEPGFQPIFEEDQFQCPEGMEIKRRHSTPISSNPVEIQN
ncbi:type IV pilin-like G/H family protein [Laspinema palackyanum]|uniref:type IV pilin-like G/H family protein n=1 Tax=Laspinema palackyanum TaxID=3231601 RepID=UPI00345C9B9A|nr:type IV pilin-like G/H family protein [Laspinema sp. D2c]